MSLSLDALNGKSSTSSGGVAPASAAEAGDRFLRLLVAQMKNQDPLNPLDNAEVTSQMAQISTVQGVEKLNGTVQQVIDQMQRMQSVQGAALVGAQVLTPGSRLAPDDQGVSRGAFDLAGPADRVQLEVLSGAGVVLGTVDMGAQSGGRHAFEWALPQGVQAAQVHSFRIKATQGAATVGATPLMRDQVQSVGLDGLSTQLTLARFGTVSLADVKAFN